jgi:hypothetical protein
MGEGWTVLVRCVGVTLGLPLVVFVLGRGVVSLVPGLQRAERFAASWPAGVAVLACCQLLAFLTGADQTRFNLTALAVLLPLGAIAWARDRRRDGALGLGWMVLLCALGYAHLVCIQTLLPCYVGSYWYFDWWMHYDEALVFRGLAGVETQWAGYNLASRTPLFNLAGAFVLSLAGDDFGIFQLATALLSSCYLPALSLVVRDLLGRRAGRLVLCLAPLNLWLLHNAWFTWPKMLAACFVLLGLHFYLRSLRCRPTDPGRAARYFQLFWISLMLGYLTHQVAAVYAAALLLHAALLALGRPDYRPAWKEWLALPLVAALIVGPWYAWLAWTFGLAQVGGRTPVTVGHPSSIFKPWLILWSVAYNTGSSTAPGYLFQALFSEPWTFADIYAGLTAMYFSLYPGILTLSVCTYLLARAVRRIPGALRAGLRWLGARLLRTSTAARSRCRPHWVAVWLFVVVGSLGATALHPARIGHGVAHSACFPTAAVLAGLAWGLLSRASRRTAALVCAGMVGEFVLMFWSHCWVAAADPRVLDPDLANFGYKDDAGLLFLNDRLGAAAPVAIAAAIAVQAALAGCLVLWLRGRRRGERGVLTP